MYVSADNGSELILAPYRVEEDIVDGWEVAHEVYAKLLLIADLVSLG